MVHAWGANNSDTLVFVENNDLMIVDSVFLLIHLFELMVVVFF